MDRRRMRRLKRAVIYVVMIAVVCTSIQACLVANAGSQEKKVINLWHWMPAQVPEAAWDARLGYFMITHPNVDLRLEVTPFQGYTDKLLVAGAAGKLPDIFGTGGVTKVDVGLMGLAEPLGKYIEREGPEYLADYPAGVLYPYKGQLYALPESVGVAALYYNKDMYETAGIAGPPETWEELVDTAVKITDPAQNQWGLSANGATWHGMREWTPFLYQAGGKLVNEDGTCALNSPEGREAFQFMVDLVTKYKVVPDWAGANEKISTLNFINEKAAMIQFAHYLRGQIKVNNPDLNYGIALQPKHKTTGSVIYGAYICLSAQAEDKDLAWEVLKFLTSEETELIYTVLTGFLPNRKSNLRKPYFANHPVMATFAQQMLLPNAYDGFPVPNMRAKYELVVKGMQEVVFGRKTTAEALTEIEREWKNID